MAHIHHQRVVREGRWGTSFATVEVKSQLQMLNPPDQMTKLTKMVSKFNGEFIWTFHLCISSQTVIPYTSGAQSTARSPILSFWCFISFMNSMPHNAVVTAQRKYCCLDITRRSQNLKPLEVHSLSPKSYLWHVLMHCPHKLCKK